MLIFRAARSALRPAIAIAAAATAGAGAEEPDPRIPYSAVLEAPDDLELNFRYARQQIADGRLDRAASTLERLLIRQPDWHEVRLLHAIVLYRLGQDGEALVELETIEPEALPDQSRPLLQRYLALARREQQRVSGDVGLTAGFHHDSNRNTFPVGGTFEINLPGVGRTLVEGTGGENGDLGWYGLVDGTVRVDTGLQSLSQVALDGAALVVDQVEEDDLDVVSGLAGVSAVIDAGVVDLFPRAYYRRIALDGSQYLAAGEARLRAERRIGADDRLRVFATALGGYEDFSGVTADPFASEADGAYLSLNAGLSHVPIDSLRLVARYDFWLKEADRSFEAFDAHQLRLSADYVVTPGISIGALATYTHQSYDAPDPFVSATRAQVDDEIEFGVAAVVSASAVARSLGVAAPPAFADGLLLNITASYRDVDSNLPNYRYDNVRFGLSLTKRFLF